MAAPLSEAFVAVPSLVGLDVPTARALANDSALTLTSGDLDGPPLSALTWPGVWRVIGQTPDAGVRVLRGSWVVITFLRTDGGEAGDREPRVPPPPRGMLPVELDEGE